MNPPSEQLIRDYLNRMSVAAGARLALRDRQALLDRTRMQIEMACGGPSAATSAQVRKILAGLGDPVAVVECEHARITAGREPAIGAESNGGTRSGASLVRVQQLIDAPVHAIRPSPDGAPAVNGARVAGTGSGAGAAGNVPGTHSAPGVDGGPSAGTDDGVGSAGDVPGTGGVPAVNGASAAGPSGGEPGRDARAGDHPAGAASDVPGTDGMPGAGPPSTGGADGRPLVPRPAVSPESAEGGFYAAPEPGGESGPRRARKPAESAGSVPDQGGLPALDRAGQSAGTGRSGGATGSVLGRLWQLADGAAVLARRNPLEAIVLVLMAAGGVAFPPIWLIGAGLAMTSKTWDLRDKWIGIAVPVLLVVCGAVLALILGGNRGSLGSYAFEAWLSAGRVSRGASVVGAGYLFWRLHRGPREPKEPPWNVPRRRG